MNWFNKFRSQRDTSGFNAYDRRDIQYIVRKVHYMSQALDRLTSSVSRVASDVSSIADQIRNHPSNDDGALDALADQLDSASTTLESVTQAQPTPASPSDGSTAQVPDPSVSDPSIQPSANVTSGDASATSVDQQSSTSGE